MFGIPVEKVLTQYAGSLPISDSGIYNVLIHLDESRELPINLSPNAVRYSLRIINALLPELDIAGAEATAMVCGQTYLADNGIVHNLVNAQGEYSGECTPQQIRAYMIDITMGMHPIDSANRVGINEADYLHLENLLEMEQYWFESVLNRVLMVRVGFGKFWKVGRELRTANPVVIWTWMREARKAEKEFKRLCAK